MIITQTPLRISFLGGNTDIPEFFMKWGGRVLTTTIDKYIYCIVTKRFDDLIIVNYTKKEAVSDVDNLQHDLVREALKLVGIEKGIEITFLADIPTAGTGLGSSSAVTVGVLNALYNYLGKVADPEKLAAEAVQIELNILRRPIGVQDQWAVALGGLRIFDFGSKITSYCVDMEDSTKEDFNNSLMLLYTDITRSSDDILWSFDISKMTDSLNFNKKLTWDGERNLYNGNLIQFGKLLNIYWQKKKKFSDKITNKKIDDMYTTAMKAGAVGGKILGAGGGGFLLIMFPANKRAKVREALKDHKELPFRFSNHGSKVIFNI